MKELLKRETLMSLIYYIVVLIFASILIINKNEMFNFAMISIGSIIIFAGILKIINYIKNKDNINSDNYEVINGMMKIIIGIVILIFKNQIETIFRIFIGIWIIVDAIIKIDFNMKFKYINNSKLILINYFLDILIIIIGIYIICNSGAFVGILGWILLMYSSINIIDKILLFISIEKLSN